MANKSVTSSRSVKCKAIVDAIIGLYCSFAIIITILICTNVFNDKSENLSDFCVCGETIKIPKGITKIPEDCFAGCYSATSVIIPEGVKYIGKKAFRGLGARYLSLPESILEIEEQAFSEARIEKMDVGPNLARLGNKAFYKSDLNYLDLSGTKIKSLRLGTFGGCRLLREIKFPEALSEIGDECFNECTSLVSVIMPDTLISIGERSFASSGVSSIKLSPLVSTIPTEAFQSTKNLEYIDTYPTLILISDSAFAYSGIKSLNFPENSYLIIEGNAFYGCLNLESISGGIISIGPMAFAHCIGLHTADLRSVLLFESMAFAYATSLKKVILSPDLTHLSTYVFYDCEGLESITLPTALEVIESHTFANTGLKEIIIPNSVKYIKEYAFNHTYLKAINFGDSPQLIAIERWAFYGCWSLADVWLPPRVETVGSYAFSVKEITVNYKTQLTLYSVPYDCVIHVYYD